MRSPSRMVVAFGVLVTGPGLLASDDATRKHGAIRICFYHPGEDDPPTRFSTTEGAGHVLISARRVGSK